MRKGARPYINVCLKIDLRTEALRRRLEEEHDLTTRELFERSLIAFEANPDAGTEAKSAA
jgi:hypothetical protein